MNNWMALRKVFWFWGTLFFITGGLSCGAGLFLVKVLHG